LLLSLDGLMLERMHSPTRIARARGIEVETLAAWRRRGYGPKWYRIGRQIKYAESDLLTWTSAQAGRTASNNDITGSPVAGCDSRDRSLDQVAGEAVSAKE
jgi:hypothetical protein